MSSNFPSNWELGAGLNGFDDPTVSTSQPSAQSYVPASGLGQLPYQYPDQATNNDSADRDIALDAPSADPAVMNAVTCLCVELRRHNYHFEVVPLLNFIIQASRIHSRTQILESTATSSMVTQPMPWSAESQNTNAGPSPATPLPGDFLFDLQSLETHASQDGAHFPAGGLDTSRRGSMASVGIRNEDPGPSRGAPTSPDPPRAAVRQVETSAVTRPGANTLRPLRPASSATRSNVSASSQGRQSRASSTGTRTWTRNTSQEDYTEIRDLGSCWVCYKKHRKCHPIHPSNRDFDHSRSAEELIEEYGEAYLSQKRDAVVEEDEAGDA